mgnify:CR=1 FL=1
MYRYLAVDSGMRYGTCVKLDNSAAFILYALAVVAVTEKGILDIYAEGGATKMNREEFTDYVESVEEAMFEKYINDVDVCIVDGLKAPACRRVVQLSKSPISDAIMTPYGFIRGATPEEIRNVAVLNNLAHRYANEYAALLWHGLQRRYTCVVPYGAHPALEYSLFV